MNKNLLTSIIFIFFFLLAGIFLLNRNPINLIPAQTPENIKSVELAGQSIKVDLALTDAQKEQGLSGRPSLRADQGMLFVFDNLNKYAFWMKGMNFPLDIIWFGADMNVVYIQKNLFPETYPETFGPSKDDAYAKYVLEVSAGFADKNNLKVGDSVEFIYHP